MKTNKTVLTVLAAIMLTILGCGGQMHGVIGDGKNPTFTHDAWSASLLVPPPSPIDMAVAYSIKKEADTKEKMISGMMQQAGGTAGLGGRYLMVLQNNDLTHNIFMWHPEIPNQKITAKPNGGFDYFTLRDIPEELVIYDMAGRILNKIQPRYIPYFNEKIAHKKQFGAFLVDLVITVNKVNDSKIN